MTGGGGGQIVDRVKIPASLPAGDYVLGFRCETATRIRYMTLSRIH
eukprot:SAG22_NODE_1123_length_5488_cov_53.464465_3_plen_46_part_00